jgi:energy-converting hydrogenase A subunit R
LNRRFFVSDCEGPISINDNAFELSGNFIDDGEKFFEIISKYDDYLVEVIKRPDYNAGGTLKFILPFLKAYGVTNANIKSFSQDTLLLTPSALDTLQYIYNLLPSFIVSTSYQQYIHALCDSTGFPYENTYSTQLDIDKYTLSSKEKIRLMEIKGEIIDYPEFENLDKIFWEELPKMRIGRIMEDVNPIGGEGKKNALKDIISKFKFKTSDLIYVGDSITDVQPLKFAYECGGLAISFNGNEYAVKEAEIVIMADNTLMISIITDLFNKTGKNGVLEFINAFIDDPQLALYNYPVDPQLTLKFPSMSNSKIGIVNNDNLNKLVNESLKYRKKIRGDVIGGLG